MIRKITLSNFRQHEDLTLEFSPDAHLIAISGPNGAGKSSILEAILYAFTGESRTGKHGLDSMIRSGAEVEGMQVECLFTVGTAEYNIARRRDAGVSSAVLSVNGEPLVEGVGPVAAEIYKILGIPPHAFKVAVMAKQGELLGLVDEKAAVRSSTIAKLAGLDDIAEAIASIAVNLRNHKDSLSNFPAFEDPQDLAARVDMTSHQHAALLATLASLQSSVSSLLERRVELKQISAEALASATSLAETKGKLAILKDSVAKDSERVQALEDVKLPSHLLRNTSEILDDLKKVDAQLTNIAITEDRAAATALLQERVTALSDKREILFHEVNALSKQLDAVLLELSQTPAPSLELLRQQERDAQKLASEATAWLQQLKNTQALSPGICPVCQQDISEQLADTLAVKLKDNIVAAEQTANKTLLAHDSATYALNEGLAAEAVQQQIQTKKDALEAAIAAAKKDIADLEGQQLFLVKQIVPPPSDSAALDSEKLGSLRAQLVDELENASRLESEKTSAALKIAERTSLIQAITLNSAAAQVLEASLRDLEEKAVLNVLEELQELEEKIENDTAIINTLTAELATVSARLKLLEERKADSENRKTTLGILKHQVEVFAASKTLLETLYAEMSTSLRPSLETSLSLLLEKMSHGRFTKASLSDTFEIKLDDNGKVRSVTDFSGGERDLIALAFRLALSDTVREVKGTPGPGFIILDEVFGFQDSSRRESILSALKELDSAYGQIFAVSHVGGLEEYADLMLSVTPAVQGEPPTVA